MADDVEAGCSRPKRVKTYCNRNKGLTEKELYDILDNSGSEIENLSDSDNYVPSSDGSEQSDGNMSETSDDFSSPQKNL
ncbi:unnamed protein product [Acanthoscelides obtectus]|uniref:Uncharacterized protein n=1 Tax=Acanthoscelides obtectus TaxID=200917 RepID=A0A9P0LTW2_ACAOB|nr:unnamed protein product [Acanthoscelides obtectus]CAK1677139.1 hypothetical protein AOBTE_LOCUS31133 [Acanthoscelides obtectus]